MAQVTAQQIKTLRERTGVGMGKCKEALQEAGGDIEQAIANLRKAGMASAVKKEGRETNEGAIKSAENDTTLALIEVNAETDFVVTNERFQEFAQNLANDLRDSQTADLSDFLAQKYSGDTNISIDEYRALTIQGLGENIQVRRIELFPKKANTSYAVYSHLGGKLVTFVEIEGASDQQALAKDIAMHIAAESPEYLSQDEVPERVLEHEKEIAKAQIKGKPENIIDKIVAGKLNAYFDSVCLLNQKFVKDASLTVDALVKSKAKESGAPLKVSQFLRWKVGE